MNETAKPARRANPSRRDVIVGLGVSAMLALAITNAAPEARADAVVAHDFVGAAQCKACHASEYDVWSKGPHARAMRELRETERKDQRCVQCHTMAPQDVAPELEGVQCETCHGPGRNYGNMHVMRDKDLRSRLLFEVPDEKTCRRCHTDSSPSLEPFDYQRMLERIRHWPARDGKKN